MIVSIFLFWLRILSFFRWFFGFPRKFFLNFFSSFIYRETKLGTRLVPNKTSNKTKRSHHLRSQQL